MSICIDLDIVLAKRKMKSCDLAKQIGITEQNLSILKTGRAKAIRFSTLEAICRALKCQPGDLLTFKDDRRSPPKVWAIDTSPISAKDLPSDPQ